MTFVAGQCHGTSVGAVGTLKKGDGNVSSGVPFVVGTLPASTGGVSSGMHPVVASLAPTLLGNGKAAGSTTQQDAENGLLIAHTLTGTGFDTSADGTGRSTPLIAFDPTQITSPTNRSNSQTGDPCHTLAQSAAAPCIAFHSTQDPISGDVAPCMGQGNKQGHGSIAVAFQTRIGRNGRGQPKEYVDALTSSEAGSHADSKPHVATKQMVRRLTPRETERLQGLPDDWTRWDDQGKELKDGPRYRMVGNAVAVPCLEWIARRLKRVMEVPHG